MNVATSEGAKGRVLPQALDAEAALAGAVLVPGIAAMLEGLVRPEDFARSENREVFEAAMALEEAGTTPDVVSVAGELRRRGSRVDGLAVRDLAANCPVPTAAPSYAAAVAQAAARRRAIVALGAATEALWDPTSDVAEVTEQALGALGAEVATGGRALGPLTWEALGELEDRAAADDTAYVRTGFGDLDELTGGLGRGNLVLIAARPGIGKSALVGNIARNVAGRGEGVAFFSLEMTAAEVAMRLLCAEAGVSYHAVRTDAAGLADWTALLGATEALADLPLVIDDGAGTRVADVRAGARRVPNLGLIVVDYLQLMPASGRR